MDVNEAIEKRRSVRAFQEKEVPERFLDLLLKAAISAPSEGNLQPWRFYVIRNERIRQELARAAHNQMFVAEPPVLIVVCIDLDATAPYGKRGRELYSIQSTAAAIEHILLTAVSLNLGTCWVGAFEEDGVSAVLNLKSSLRPVALIPVGYPAESPLRRGRRPVDDVTHFIE